MAIIGLLTLYAILTAATFYAKNHIIYPSTMPGVRMQHNKHKTRHNRGSDLQQRNMEKSGRSWPERDHRGNYFAKNGH